MAYVNHIKCHLLHCHLPLTFEPPMFTGAATVVGMNAVAIGTADLTQVILLMLQEWMLLVYK